MGVHMREVEKGDQVMRYPLRQRRDASGDVVGVEVFDGVDWRLLAPDERVLPVRSARRHPQMNTDWVA